MIPRTLADLIRRACTSFPIIWITGPRQSGKTTLAKTMFPEFAYRDLEAFDARRTAEEDPSRFILNNIDRGIIIDEVQRIPELFSYLQIIVDERDMMGKVILTGTPHSRLLESVTKLLSGRIIVLSLLPFTAAELHSVQHDDIDSILFKGMYPPVHDRDIDPTQFYPTYLQTFVERDVRLMRNIGDLSTFARFLKLCAGHIGRLVNMSSLAVETGVDHKIIQNSIFTIPV